MTDFSSRFSRKRVLLIVNHAEEASLALENARIAFGEGADGMFMINHRKSDVVLKDNYLEVRKALGNKVWIGLNVLNQPLARAVPVLPPGTSGLWTDNAGYQDGSEDPTFTPRAFSQIRYRLRDESLYFGGVSFKGQHDTNDIPAACRAAVDCKPYVDVITTSGTGTGTAPNVEKIASMRKALGDHPLAIASGVTVDNVDSFLPFVDAILCATGVSLDFTHLDPIKVRNLAKRVHA